MLAIGPRGARPRARALWNRRHPGREWPASRWFRGIEGAKPARGTRFESQGSYGLRRGFALRFSTGFFSVSGSPGNCSSSLPAMATFMISIQMGSAAGAGFLFAEGLAAVVADPDAAGDRRRKAHEPGVGVVAGGTGFPTQRVIHLRDGSACPVGRDGAKKRHHGACRLLADDLVDGRRIFPERDAVGVGDLLMRRGFTRMPSLGKTE